jgi:plastocyanin
MTRSAYSIILLATLFTGCSKSSHEVPAASAETTSVAAPPASVSGSGPGAVSGRLPAATGGLPSIIVLEPQGTVSMPPQAETPYMDQIQQTFIPPVLMVRTGQPVDFRNSDDVLHNVRVREDATHSPAFNVAIPTGEKFTFTFPRDGFYDVGCDIHPGMSAQIVSTDTPYTAVADQQGNYVIENVPAGAYKAIVYAGAEKIERDVTVSGATTLNVNHDVH